MKNYNLNIFKKNKVLLFNRDLLCVEQSNGSVWRIGERGLLSFFVLFMFSTTFNVKAQTIFEKVNHTFKTSGYLRTGVGQSEGGETQAHFQMPGAQNKYSLGNQADTYGELEFDYSYYFDKEKSKSLDVIWMSSIYEDFGTDTQMSFNKTEQLYVRANNFLGNGEVIWAGKRFYDRRAEHMLDRQWVNPGQRGWGVGMEKLIQKGTDEDIKFGIWAFQERGKDISFINGAKDHLRAYTADVRYVHLPISETLKMNVSLNYSYRAENEIMEYDAKHGFAVISWLDYEKKYITNTTALIFRQGASIPIHHWSGMSEKENPGNDNIVLNDNASSYFLEINNNFLYDDKETFAVNGILSAVMRDYGTKPYEYNSANPTNKAYLKGRDKMLYWLTAGARGMYYLSNNFKLHLELTHEYIKNEQLNVSGNLDKITFTPELSLEKGFYARPVLRPFVTYAFWSDDLKGLIGNTPNGAPFGNNTSGFTYGLQFEIWW
ncbi:carbohydrate porin [Polaribacter sp. HaHaR_3_91]|uniref:carbohydrate porin n=1 Tax=Polaribacter sp. HaHaR_3_91 TaxID=2745561 RepID=UPI001C4E8AFF|nr:carbohydrate porin [Polaribacter sp. HaHaR_3_91]QXP62262.1 carbohydrate porin [Polaribacter sp. HaHaR_3_91]